MEGERKKGGGRRGRWWEEKREPSILRTSIFKEISDKKFGEKANKDRGNSATKKRGEEKGRCEQWGVVGEDRTLHSE